MTMCANPEFAVGIHMRRQGAPATPLTAIYPIALQRAASMARRKGANTRRPDESQDIALLTLTTHIAHSDIALLNQTQSKTSPFSNGTHAAISGPNPVANCESSWADQPNMMALHGMQESIWWR